MKLYPLIPTSRLAVNIGRISRKIGIDALTLEPTALTGIIVLANGTPDDWVVALISHHLNGRRKILGIVKPEVTRLGVLNSLPTYLEVLKGDKIAILVDQEDEKLDSLFNEVGRKLSEIGISAWNVVKERRLWVYDCKRGGKEFRLIVVVNGLDDYPFEKHSIEDHLLKAAERLLKIEVNERDPKKGWNKLKDRQVELFRKLKNIKNLNDIFPQQIRGLKMLLDET